MGLHVPRVMGMVIPGCAPGEQPSCPPRRHSLSCCPYRKTVRVKIVDEEEYERQENFFIALGEPKWMERGISGVRFFENQSSNQEKAKKKERNLSKRGNNRKEKVTLFLPPPFVPFSSFSYWQKILCFPSCILTPTLFRCHLCLLSHSLFPYSSFPTFWAVLQPQLLIALVSYSCVVL